MKQAYTIAAATLHLSNPKADQSLNQNEKKQKIATVSKKSAEKKIHPLKKMDIPKSKIKRSRADGLKDVEFEVSRKAKDYLIYGRNAILCSRT